MLLPLAFLFGIGTAAAQPQDYTVVGGDCSMVVVGRPSARSTADLARARTACLTDNKEADTERFMVMTAGASVGLKTGDVTTANPLDSAYVRTEDGAVMALGDAAFPAAVAGAERDGVTVVTGGYAHTINAVSPLAAAAPGAQAYMDGMAANGVDTVVRRRPKSTKPAAAPVKEDSTPKKETPAERDARAATAATAGTARP